MNNNDIAMYVYTSTTYNNIIMNFIRRSAIPMRDFADVKSDIMLIILRGSQMQRMMFDAGKFRGWFIGICTRQIKSNKSRMYKTYVTNSFEGVEINEMPHYTEFIHTEDDVIERIDTLNKFNYVLNVIGVNLNKSQHNKKIFELYKMYYIEDLTYDAIAKKTRILPSSVFNYIRDAKAFLEKEIDKNLFI